MYVSIKCSNAVTMWICISLECSMAVVMWISGFFLECRIKVGIWSFVCRVQLCSGHVNMCFCRVLDISGHVSGGAYRAHHVFCSYTFYRVQMWEMCLWVFFLGSRNGHSRHVSPDPYRCHNLAVYLWVHVTPEQSSAWNSECMCLQFHGGE